MKKAMKTCVAAASALMLALGCTSPAMAEEASDSHLNVALYLWMEGLDPAEGWNGWTTMRCGIGETLLTADENMDVVPCLADSWEQIDELTYSFHIRQGVKFSNGNDLTPETVKESIERTAAQNSRGGNLKLDSIEVDGENVIFKTTEPYSAFVYYLTEPMCIIVDTTVDMTDYNSSPVCTGPYVCEEYVTEQKYELVANEYYWDGAPSVKSITVQNIAGDTKASAMLSGDLDVAVGASATTLAQLEGNDQIEMVSVTGTRESDLEMNCREGRPTADVNLRKALSYAIDRNVIAQISGNGYATALGKAFPDSVGYGSDGVEEQTYDLEKAAEYLAAAGYEDADGNGYVEKDGEELVLTIALRSNASTAVYQAMQDMWKEIGVHVEIELMENTSEIRDSGEFDFIAAGWQTVNNADGQSYLKNRWSDGGPDNYSGFHSDAFQEVMERLDAAFELEDRIDCFVEAQKVLNEECPTIFLCADDNITLVNTSRVDNVTVFPIDYYMITNDWTIVE
ncbi:MAG: ABC transporter substrate-binding protein [Eubacteriales bacterium]|nr:ABC transporter substrate-binding protein [Eubacteriales bacterium]